MSGLHSLNSKLRLDDQKLGLGGRAGDEKGVAF